MLRLPPRWDTGDLLSGHETCLGSWRSLSAVPGGNRGTRLPGCRCLVSLRPPAEPCALQSLQKQPQSCSLRSARSCCCSRFHRRPEETVLPENLRVPIKSWGERMLSREPICSLVEVGLGKCLQRGCLPYSTESHPQGCSRPGPFLPAERPGPDRPEAGFCGMQGGHVKPC